MMVPQHSNRLPNTLYIGPDKAGSTWLYWQMRAHPEAYVPETKELFFFDRYFDRGVEWYAQFYRAAPPWVKVITDISHDYLYHPNAAARCNEILGHANCICFVREPIDRAISSYYYMVAQGRTVLALEDALEAIPELLEKGHYARYLEKWEKYPGLRVGIFVFDDLTRNGAAFWKQLCEFLGIAPTSPASVTPRKRLAAREARAPGLIRMGRRIAWWLRDRGAHELVWRIKNMGVLQRILWRPLRAEIPLELRQRLREKYAKRYAEDIRWLSGRLGRDLAREWGYDGVGA